MALCMTIPSGPSWSVRDLRIVLRSAAGSWLFDQTDLDYRARVESVEIGSDDKHHRATIYINPAGESDQAGEIMPQLDLADVADLVGPGEQIAIYAEAPENKTGGGPASRSFLFHGFAPCPTLRFSETAIEPTAICTSLLERVDAQEHAVVQGRYMAYTDSEEEEPEVKVRHIETMPAVFNWKGRGNRHKDLHGVTIGDVTVENVPVFTYDGDPEAVPWKLGDVLTYLLVCHFNPAGLDLGIADGNGVARCGSIVTANGEPGTIADPDSVTWDEMIATQAPELAMETMPIVEKALPLWCRAGGFRMMQVTLNNGGEPETTLAFWIRGEGGPFKTLGSSVLERALKEDTSDPSPSIRSMTLPQRDTNLANVSLAEVRRAEVLFDSGHVVTSCTVRGDPILHEITAGLGCATKPADTFFPLWAPDEMFGDNLSGEDVDTKAANIKETILDEPTGDAATMKARYTRDGADHQGYTAVGRLWGLNEAGEYLGEGEDEEATYYGRTNNDSTIWNAQAYKPYDFHANCSVPKISVEGEEDPKSWAPRRRGILSLLSRSMSGDSRRPILQCSFDSGATWCKYPGSYEFANSLDPERAQMSICLISLNLAKLEDKISSESVWSAIVKGTFRLALTCTIMGEECVKGESGTGAGWGGCERHVELKMKPGELVKHVQANSSLDGAAGWTFDERDDSGVAAGRAKRHVRTYGSRLISGTVMMPFATNDWLPGDLCNGIQPRGVSFTTLVGGTRYPEVVRVLIRNENTQSTQITLDDLRTMARSV